MLGLERTGRQVQRHQRGQVRLEVEGAARSVHAAEIRLAIDHLSEAHFRTEFQGPRECERNDLTEKEHGDRHGVVRQ